MATRTGGPLQQLLTLATQRADVIVAMIVVAVIFMMVLPLPTWLVDVLLGFNLAISALLLMVAMYLPSPLAFSSFPSVLLITTLFRLSLSVTTTRLILLQGDAGHIVETFGNLVVGGNIVVGLVVFLILTIVQFIVITKGAERVAEVAARFSLDGMPGKQMSIDGDMRAGTITMDEAKRRRNVVEKESQLYGAMDGAMKFVKGDAIASLIIVVVNLLGGLTIGVFQRGLPAAEAMHIYSILTIGDGLVAQLPALFISITSGIIVTRVTNDGGEPSNVGRDITQQLLAQPKALLIAATVMLLFSIVPGMPSSVFLTLATISGGIGLILLRSAKEDKEAAAAGGAGPGSRAAPSADKSQEFYPSVPLMLAMAPDLESTLNPTSLNTRFAELRKALYFDLGVPFPGIYLQTKPLEAETYHLALNEVPIAQGKLRKGHVLVCEKEENLQALDIPVELDEPFLPGQPTLWCADSQIPALTEHGIVSLNHVEIVVRHMTAMLRKHANEFLGIEETRFIIGILDKDFPELAKEVQRVLPVQRIAEVLQRLVSEGVSVRNLRVIGEGLIDWGAKEKDPVLLTEHIRSALKRQITHQHTGGQSVLAAYLLSPDLEETIRSAIRQTSAGSYLALDPATGREFLERVKETVGNLAGLNPVPVILTSMDIRRFVRRLIESALYELPVLAYQELASNVNVQPLARIDLD